MINRFFKFYSNEIKHDFKDVLIVPKSGIRDIRSRSDVNLEKKIYFKTPGKTVHWQGVPIISSNMDTVTSLETFNVLRDHNYVCCMPKHYNKLWLDLANTHTHTHTHNVCSIPNELKCVDNYMISCGVNEGDVSVAINLVKALQSFNIHVKFLCIDVANGYLNKLKDVCLNIRTTFPDIVIVAGNVVTSDITYKLINGCGVNIVKVGIGSGSVCETRLKAGVGYPQLSAVLECADAAHQAGGYIISDGGIEHPCDVVKAFSAGADFVMAGSLFAGHSESPGESHIDPYTQQEYKGFYGMSSEIALMKYNDGKKNYRTSEGKLARIKVKGSLHDTVQDINGSIRSACTYVNAIDLNELYTNTQFINVTHHHNTSL